MIVRMSRVEIMGPRQLLEDALGVLQHARALHPEQEGFAPMDMRDELVSLRPGDREAAERESLASLRTSVIELLGMLPPGTGHRTSYIAPETALEKVAGCVDRHIENVRSMRRRAEELSKETEELSVFMRFFRDLGAMYEALADVRGIEFIGVRLKFSDAVGAFRSLLGRLTEERFELVSEPLSDSSAVALVLLPKSLGDSVRAALGRENIPELGLPDALSSLSFAEKSAWIESRVAGLRTEAASVAGKLHDFARGWRPMYDAALGWAEARLAMFEATANAFGTGQCFVLYGWMPGNRVAIVRSDMDKRFGGSVIVNSLKLRDKDMPNVPVAIWNPRWLRPFELFTRLLPLPRYTSYDPTPFLAIFFPVFFGFVLGDAGYGALLAALCAYVLVTSKKPVARDAAIVFLVASVYTILFGLLYGEVFGSLGRGLTSFMPVRVDRKESVIPMLGVAIGVGFFHVTLGFVLGIISSVRAHEARKAVYRAGSAAACICIGLLVAGRAGIVTEPNILAAGVVLAVSAVALVVGDGVLGLLEFLKSLGNIISYARLMAIGLTSVLLAYVANLLGVLVGHLALGLFIGFLMHSLNFVLGVFSPTIHSIRLHYVEFFGKFMETGGRPFTPLK